MKVGDIIISKDHDTYGLKGRIICLNDTLIGVEFPKFHGHDLGGRLESCNGWWLTEDDIAEGEIS